MATVVGASSGSPPPHQMQMYDDDETPLFTCLSCSIAFPNPEDQRTHYRSDLHRYNMKRRVANLPPVKADVFNAKIIERRAQQSAEQSQANVSNDKCAACNKTFLSQNAYKDHLNSRKHKDNEARMQKPSTSAVPVTSEEGKQGNDGDAPLVFRVLRPAQADGVDEVLPNAAEESTEAKAEKKQNLRQTLMVNENATEEEIQAAVDAKVASSRRIDPAKECIFCSASGFDSLAPSMAHMSKVHGFFIPDSEYLVDLPGLMSYLADKVSVGNICLYCNGKGRGFHEMSAVRKHMIDKCHCKIAYELEVDQLEFADFYDFTSSYPVDEDEEEDAEWEDADGDEGMEDLSGDEDEEDDDEIVDLTLPRGTDRNQGVRYGDSENELILASGARIGHRSLRRYYEQNLSSHPSLYDHEDSQRFGGGSALARRLIHDSGMGHHKRDGTLVKDRGGQVVKARNRGEAKEAKRHIREFRDVARKEAYKTRVAFTNNNQKHFRDPLLQ